MTTPYSNRPGRAAADAAAYIRAILDLLGERDALEVLGELPGAVRAMTAGLDAETAARPEAPGKWSVLEVVRHLADSEIVFSWRLRLPIAQDQPPLTGFDQEAWSVRLAGAYPTLASALGVLEVLRAANLALLGSLQPLDWERVGVHVERGPETVRHMAKLYAGHDLVHRNQIARILRGMGGA